MGTLPDPLQLFPLLSTGVPQRQALLHVWWPHSPGRSRRGSGSPPKTSPDSALALPTVCLSHLTSGPRFYNGPTALNLPVIQGSNGPRTSYSAGSGGRHWMRTFGVSSMPVPPATSTSRLTMPLPVFYILCLCLIVPGHTFIWTSSPVYHHPVATLLS